MSFLGWTTEKIIKLLMAIYGGKYSSKNLPPELYDSTLDKLSAAILDGFGDMFNPEFEPLRDKLIDNISVFSAAKTHQQVSLMEKYVFNESGGKAKFADFKKKAGEIFDAYNNNYLEAEFNTAFARAQAARQWIDIEANKKVLPLLKYVTVGDERVRSAHKLLDGIVRPVNDPFWDKNYPPNGFRCRCIVMQLEADEEPATDLRKVDFPKTEPLFASNPAKTGIVFDSSKHPYFNVSDRYYIAPRSKDGKIQKIKK